MSERQKRYEQKQRENGMIRRSYWIPADREALIKRFIEEQTNREEAN